MFVRRLLTAVPANASLFAQTGVKSSLSAALLRPVCMTPVSAFTPLRFFSEDGSSERRQGGFNRAPRRRQENRDAPREPREYKTFTTDDFKTSSVLIVNLPYTMNAQGVKDTFASVGNIEYVKILRRDDGLPLGRAIVRFSEVSSAQTAFEKFNATELPGTGRKIHLKPAQQPQNRFIVFVSGLPSEATTEQLTEFFASAGNVLSSRIREGRNDGAVFFATEEEAQKAIQLNGSTFQGTSIRVNLPQPRSEENKVEESS